MQEYLDLLQEANRIANTTPNPGRNDMCPCGSGKKYKKCHATLDEQGVPDMQQMSSEGEEEL